MLEITKENYKDITFDGIIISVPKEHLKDQLTQEFCFQFECAFYSRGKHGYPQPGSKPDNSSFFTACYNHEYLPNGLMFNSSTRLPWDEKYKHFNNVRYYKFDDMQEFCTWYLQQKGAKVYTSCEDLQGLVPPIEPKNVCQCCKKQKRYEKLKDVQTYVQLLMNIQYNKYLKLFEPDCSADEQQAARLQADKLRSELLGWLEEEV